MRKIYLLMATIALLATGCKKETTAGASIQSTVDQSAQSVIGTGCYGNNWTNGGDFNGYEYNFWPVLVYNNKAYVFNSPFSPPPGNISIFDGSTWTIKSTKIPWGSMWVDFAFVIGNKGYFGYTYEFDKQVYEYDFDANTWTYKANYPGPDREYEAFFSIGNKGYIVGGYQPGSGGNLVYFTDTWEFDPTTNAWTQKASLPSFTFGRINAVGFTMGNKGYIVGGDRYISPNYRTYFNSLLQYDPSADTWTYKAYFPGAARTECQQFVISGLGYVGGGYSSDMQNIYTYHKDFYKYNPSTDTWTQIPLIPGLGFLRHSFAINSRGYVAHDNINSGILKMEKYTPYTCLVLQ